MFVNLLTFLLLAACKHSPKLFIIVILTKYDNRKM